MIFQYFDWRENFWLVLQYSIAGVFVWLWSGFGWAGCGWPNLPILLASCYSINDTSCTIHFHPQRPEAAKHHRLCEGESKKLDLQVLQVCQGLCRLVKMHSYALPPPGGHSIEISATSAANKSSAPPNGPFWNSLPPARSTPDWCF